MSCELNVTKGAQVFPRSIRAQWTWKFRWMTKFCAQGYKLIRFHHIRCQSIWREEHIKECISSLKLVWQDGWRRLSRRTKMDFYPALFRTWSLPIPRPVSSSNEIFKQLPHSLHKLIVSFHQSQHKLLKRLQLTNPWLRYYYSEIRQKYQTDSNVIRSERILFHLLSSIIQMFISSRFLWFRHSILVISCSIRL